LYRNDKKYTEAIDVLKQVESNSEVPSEMRYRVQLDVCYLTELSGDKKGAAEKFVAIGSNTFIPEDFRCEANYSAGRIYSDLKDYTNAVKYLGKAKNAVAITKDGGNMTIYFWQGLAKSLYELLPDSAIAAVMKAGEPKAPQDKQ
jgi:tetratricopeptide (TPR) repeat protein